MQPPPLEDQLKEYINANLMGKATTLKGPFGRKQVVYADLTSTGRSLKFIEKYVTAEILPTLSDGHSMTTVTGLQTALYFDETKYVVRKLLPLFGNK